MGPAMGASHGGNEFLSNAGRFPFTPWHVSCKRCLFSTAFLMNGSQFVFAVWFPHGPSHGGNEFLINGVHLVSSHGLLFLLNGLHNVNTPLMYFCRTVCVLVPNHGFPPDAMHFGSHFCKMVVILAAWIVLAGMLPAWSLLAGESPADTGGQVSWRKEHNDRIIIQHHHVPS